MRYIDSGELHKDFHLATNKTIDYIMKTYDQEFLAELCRRTAQDVYQDIYYNLKKGNSEPFLEHLSYYTDREGGKYTIERKKGEILFHMNACPMIQHITSSGQSVSPYMQKFFELLLYYWSQETPFSITLHNYHDSEYSICIGGPHASSE